MANEKNLTHKLTVNDQRAGGKKSGEIRRRKRDTAKIVEKMLCSKLNAKDKEEVEKISGELEKDEMTVNALMIAGQIKAAMCGNVGAFQNLQSYLERNSSKDDFDSDYTIPITEITVDFLETYRTVHKIFDGKSDIQEIILKGGRGSIKSNFWSALVEETIRNDPQAHCVVTRRYKTDLRNSVYSQFMKTITRHNKLEDWEFTTSPLMAKYKKTGQCVLFVGADKPLSLKSYNLSFGYIKLLINEECDEMAGIEQLDNIYDTFIRADAPAINIKVFNPPKSANNFMNEYTASKVGDRLSYISHSYYYNVPKEWLGERFFQRAEWFKEHKPKYYANNYLGEVTGTGGAIFENLELRKITDDEIKRMSYFYYGLDFGYEHPQTFIKCFYDFETDILYPIEEVYSRRCKNATFANKIKKYKNVEIIADSARPDNISEMNDWGFDVVGAVKRWGINKGRDYCWEWLRQCNKIVVDRERTPYLANEMTKLEFELLKDGTFSSEYPKLGEDCVMALIYALNRVIKESRREDLYEDEEELNEGEEDEY